MEKKIGRTFAQATDEYIKEHGSLEGYHRDLDEVLADKSLSEAFNSYMKENPEAERKFWEDALEVNLSIGKEETPWAKNIRKALETGKFPPKPVEDH